MRKGFSMIELIMTMVIMGILASGAYISVSKLYTKKSKSKAISELSLDSSRISSQISALLAYRVPASVIGYDMQNGSFESIYALTQEYGALEWIGQDFEQYRAGRYSGFIDFDACDKTTLLLHSPNTDIDSIIGDDNDTALIFAGAFDEGMGYGSGFLDSFGWHHHDSAQVFSINNDSTDNNITLLRQPDALYEKYYLASSAFAITRKADVNASCNFPADVTLDDNALLLYYNYKPWLGETFCKDANVTVLSTEARGFTVDFINGNLQFNLTLERSVRKSGKDLNITISKEKVVF